MSFIKTRSAQTMGFRTTTDLDTRKANADFLIQSIAGSRYYIEFNRDVNISGRGIVKVTSTQYSVTLNALNNIKEKFTNETNF